MAQELKAHCQGVHRLFQFEQNVFAPVSFQTACDLLGQELKAHFPACFDMRVSQIG